MRSRCTYLVPLRSFLLRQQSSAPRCHVTDAGRCFGSLHSRWSEQQRQPFTTCFAARTAVSETALASGEYGAEQIQVCPVCSIRCGTHAALLLGALAVAGAS